MKRIAVIGGGPSGMGVLHAFDKAGLLKEGKFEVTVFEKQDHIGGLWNFSWHTGTDQYGELCPNSMYRYLWSNGPKECLEFPDFTFEKCFGKQIPSYPPRPVIEKYLKTRYEHLKHLVKLSTVVRSVRPDDAMRFTVVSTNLKTDVDETGVFDYIFVCTGHYNNPKVVHYPGFESFTGRFLHAHDFRDGREFKDQVVVTLGSSYSAEDIGSQVLKYGAKKVYLSARQKDPTAPWYAYKWPENMVRKPCLTKIEGKTVYFEDGTTCEADAFICCTGYRHYYPFLEKENRLNGPDLLYPDTLYKGIFWQNDPRIMYIGAQHQWFTFPQFEIQAFYARDVITGKIPLPSKAARTEDIKKWVAGEHALPDENSGIQFQADYIKELCKATDYPKFDTDLMAQNFRDFVANKCVDIMKFRDLSHTDQTTLKPSPSPKLTWMDALDDSAEAYLKNC